MPDVQIFYGRKKEFEDLKQSILEKLSRAIILCGQSRIGKTALAAKLAEQVKSDFDCFSWRSLNYSPPPTLSKLLFGLIKVLSSEENTGLPRVVDDFNVDGLIKKLLKIFGEHRILLVLDGWEKILQTQNLKGSPAYYQKYGELLKQIPERRHESCIVITTQ